MERYFKTILVAIFAILPMLSLAQNRGDRDDMLIDIDVKAPYVSEEFATIKVETKIPQNLYGESLKLVIEIKNNVGNIVAYEDRYLNDDEKDVVIQTLTLENPWLWSEENPYLYTVERKIYKEDTIIDNSRVYIALKDFYYLENKGFILNGSTYNLRAVRYKTHQIDEINRFISLMKNLMLLREMGCNTIIVDDNLYDSIERITNVMGIVSIKSSSIESVPELFDKVEDLDDLIDNAFIPKDKYYYYQSIWNKDLEQLHLLPHWNWKGREGEITPVLVYTNYPKVELFVNGESKGVSEGCRNLWYDVEYEPGNIKAVAYNEDDEIVAQKILNTPSKPHHIKVINHPEITLPLSRGFISFVTLRVVDETGELVNDYNKKISVKVKSGGELVCLINSSKSDNYTTKSSLKAHNGELTLIIRSSGESKELDIDVKGKGVK